MKEFVVTEHFIFSGEVANERRTNFNNENDMASKFSVVPFRVIHSLGVCTKPESSISAKGRIYNQFMSASSPMYQSETCPPCPNLHPLQRKQYIVVVT